MLCTNLPGADLELTLLAFVFLDVFLKINIAIAFPIPYIIGFIPIA